MKLACDDIRPPLSIDYVDATIVWSIGLMILPVCCLCKCVMCFLNFTSYGFITLTLDTYPRGQSRVSEVRCSILNRTLLQGVPMPVTSPVASSICRKFRSRWRSRCRSSKRWTASPKGSSPSSRSLSWSTSCVRSAASSISWSAATSSRRRRRISRRSVEALLWRHWLGVASILP